MSEIKTGEHYYTKEFGGYKNSEDNFVARQELTVTITLNEYRELIGNKAIMDKKISDVQSEKYKLSSKNNDLEKENSSLKEKLFDLQNEINELKCVKTSEDIEDDEDEI